MCCPTPGYVLCSRRRPSPSSTISTCIAICAKEHPELIIVVARPDSAAEAIIGSESGVFSLQELEPETTVESAGGSSNAPPGPDEPFVIVYTSGTTSRAKGCVHTFNTYCRARVR